MTRFVLAAALTVMLTLTCVQRAEARIFEPQRDWWHSGRTCFESRSPAGLDWDGSPPRACVEREFAAVRKQAREEEALAFKDETWTIAFVGVEHADKAPAKILT
jgi:hypothetical protein